MKVITLNLSLPECEQANSLNDAKIRLARLDHKDAAEVHADLDRQYQLAVSDRVDIARKREVVSQLLAPTLADDIKRMLTDDAVDKVFSDMVAGGAVMFDVSWT